jgi:hypothetical protein
MEGRLDCYRRKQGRSGKDQIIFPWNGPITITHNYVLLQVAWHSPVMMHSFNYISSRIKQTLHRKLKIEPH